MPEPKPSDSRLFGGIGSTGGIYDSPIWRSLEAVAVGGGGDRC